MKENFISCVLWVPKGVSKTVPDEVKLSPEEMKALIQETKNDIKDIEPDFKDNEDLDGENEDETEDKDEVDEDDENKSEEGDEDEENGSEEDDEDDLEVDEEASEDKESEEGNEDDTEEKQGDTEDKAGDSDEDIISKYDLDNYDDDDGGRPCMRINDVTMFVDNKDDQYMEESNSEDEDKKEEEEDMHIKKEDNLLVVGHVDGERCSVEVYVYNKQEDAFYVHHEMDMAAFPVSLEWMDFHPSGEERGSYVVVGDMTPVISVWDLDVVGASVPDYCLGKKPSKKNKQKKTDLIGHTDAVVSLSWNKKITNILASGSADKTIILWDLLNCRGEKLLEYHKGDVQALEWDPLEFNYLLSGCTEGLIRIYDYSSGSDKPSHKWKVKGEEIERVCWHKSQSSKFLCSTDKGFVYGFDMNVPTYEHCIRAHKDNVTVLDLSPDYPNLLMTGGYDQFIKVWDLDRISKQSDGAMMPVYQQKTVVAKIYAAKFAPDSELIVAVGGHCSSNNLKVMDLGELKPGVKSVQEAIPEDDMDEEVDESASHSLTSQKKKKKKKAKKINLNGGRQSTQSEVYADSPICTENDMDEDADESASHLLPTSQKKKKKAKKIHLNGGEQSTQNDEYAAGPSCTGNDMDEELDECASLQFKTKKNKVKRFHPYERQQNDNSAGPSCSNGNNNFVPKKKKKRHSK